MKHFDNLKSVIVKNDESSFSGILLFDNYILITAHLLALSDDNSKFFVIQEQNDRNESCAFSSQEAFPIGCLPQNKKRLERHLEEYFGEIYDFADTIADLVELFTIYVLSFTQNADLNELVRRWHSVHSDGEKVRIADEIFFRAAPFGSRHLINSYSQGIVSNQANGILLTDCPSVFGSEGGLIFAKTNGQPIGIVVSSMAGWRGEATGLTLGITFNALFNNTDDNDEKTTNTTRIKQVVDKMRKSVVYVTCGSTWGTGLCLDKKKGIFVTNSHVVNQQQDVDDVVISILSNGKPADAQILFQVPSGENYDVAILQRSRNLDNYDLELDNQLEDVKFAYGNTVKVGDPVFSAGFPLFPYDLHLNATITQGHVALIKDNVLMTTCTVLPGGSGGGLFNTKGELIGIVTCNISNNSAEDDAEISYPRVNMNIPVGNIREILEEFKLTEDVGILRKLILEDQQHNGWQISKL